MDNPSPALRRRQAGARLRQLREAAGVSMERVAEFLDCSVAKISRIETGRLLARIPDVRHMLDLYQVTGPERDELLTLVGQSRQKSWWHDHTDAIGSETHATFLGLHDAAADITEYAPYLLPELLQTPDYTRAILTTLGDPDPIQVERMVRLRAAHQRAVLHRPDPPRIVFLLDEATVYRTTGCAATWQAQLARIIELAGREHITVGLVPFTAGPTAACGVAFTRLGFADSADPPAVFLDRPHDSHIETRPVVVDHYTRVAQHLRSIALTPARTLDQLTGQRAGHPHPTRPVPVPGTTSPPRPTTASGSCPVVRADRSAALITVDPDSGR